MMFELLLIGSRPGSCLQVVSAIGAPEGDLLGAFKNVKKIDGEGAIALVKAAEEAGVQHFVMVGDLALAARLG